MTCTMWLTHAAVLVSVITTVAGVPPTFQCENEYPGSNPDNNCYGTYIYHDMDGSKLLEPTAGNQIYTLRAVDKDAGDSITFGIEPYLGVLGEFQGDGFEYLDVGGSSGNVTAKIDIDYEKIHLLRIIWKLTDSTGESSTTEISADVVNINDNNPEFTSPRYQMESIPENSRSPDDLIFTVTATDLDSTDGIRYDVIQKYSVWPCNGDIFEIDSISGNITLKENETLDFEASSLYTICVKVTDSGEPGASGDVARFGYAQVIVAVQDAQDTAPYFTESNYDREIQEDIPVGSEVEQVQAREGDRGVLVPNVIVYSLTGGDGKFQIDNTTGWVTIMEMLDRERSASHTIDVKAQEIQANGFAEVEPSSGVVKITFQVGDVDDKNATFSLASVNVTLSENSLERSFVSLEGLSVTDEDQAPNDRFFLSLGGPDSDAFTIQSREIRGEGAVDVRIGDTDKLDYEKNETLEFEIYAGNGAGIVYDTVYIHVTLLDQNDETPTFRQERYIFQIKENSKGDFVGLINATDDDSASYSQITYQLFGQGDPPQFEMNSMTGEIRTLEGADLDYEGQNVYFFTCVASDGQRSGTATVQIKLRDENDYAPEFSPSSGYTTQVFENNAPVIPLLTVSANDLDQGTENGKISYSLLNESLSERFSIDPKTGVISLLEALDYELDGPNFELTVIATDGGDVPLTANATVRVLIQDMNDQSPIFSQGFYSGNVSEDASRGKVVLQVTATDGDSDGSVNSYIDYFFDDDSVSDFRIGIRSGVITVNSGNLDRDEQGTHSFKVNAIDRGEPPNNGSCYVNITLLDVNNKPPEFSEPDPTVRIYENISSDSLVAMVTASDPDETANLSYSIGESVEAFKQDGSKVTVDSSGWFHIDDSTGDVFTGREPLDRENFTSFKIPITVEDMNTVMGTRTAEVTLTLILLDVNDNAPEFSESIYRFTVIENTPVGSVISTDISATDMDEGSNREIRYELAADVDFLMMIDPVTGVLKINGPFDREAHAEYNSTVRALDNGSPVLSSTATIQITIRDVNDNDPQFDARLNTTIAVFENYPNETAILQVVAQDNDATEEFGEVTYEITAGDPDDIFTINSTTGWIMIKEGNELDREAEDMHRLTVSASDDDGRQDTTEVTITVLDINDNAPEFTSDSNDIRLQESVEIGQLVATVTATDQDQADTNNSKVEYFITGGNGKGLFEITTNSDEGVVKTSLSLSNRVGVHTLKIVARDKGIPSQESLPYTLKVVVTDVNDDAPEITSPYNLEDIPINENKTGYVLNVTAIDTDAGANGIIDFSFVKSVGVGGRDDEYFNITNMDNGMAIITIRGTTDRETKDIYYLEVQVKDRGEFPLDSSVSFTVSVTDCDDNDPLFWTDPNDRATAMFNVPENDETADIGLVNLATDADLPENQHLNYFIVDGNSKEQFLLNMTTGQLSLQRALDRERNQTFSLVVKVTSDPDYSPTVAVPYDARDNTLLQVNITVTDTNDSPPVFEEKLYTGGAKDSAEYGSEVIVVKANDRDLGDNAVVLYKLLSEKYTDTDGNDKEIVNSFEVKEFTGSVRTLRVFQKGDAGYFTIVVQAQDSLNSEFTDQATVSIYLYSEDQQVKMTIFKTTDTVRGYLPAFMQTIEEIILKYADLNSAKRSAETIVPVFVLDDLQVRTNDDNQAMTGWSDMWFHVVNRLDNTIIAPVVIVNAIDAAYDYAELIQGVYGVNEIFYLHLRHPVDLTWVQWLLLGFLCATVVLVIGLVATNCILTSSYKRKLRAATAGMYESLNPTSKATNHAPNTNKFAEPGSNPVFGSKISVEPPDMAETADEECTKEPIGNGNAKQIPTDPRSEEQEMVLEMYDDSADFEQVADEETGDRLIMQLLQDVDKKRLMGQVTLPDFTNLTITEI